MFLAYKFGLIKVTAKFRRIMTMMIFGYVIFAIVNFIFAVVTDSTFGFGGAGGLGIAHLALRGRPGVVHPRARLRLHRRSDPHRRPAEVLVAPRARPDRHPGLALHRVPAPVRPSAFVTEHLTNDTAGAGSPAPAVSSAVAGCRGRRRRRRRPRGARRARPDPPPLGRAPARPCRVPDAGAPPPPRRPRPPLVPTHCGSPTADRRGTARPRWVIRNQSCRTSGRPSSSTSSACSSGTPTRPGAATASRSCSPAPERELG